MHLRRSAREEDLTWRILDILTGLGTIFFLFF